MKTLYMGVGPEDISKYVIFSGDPFRVEMLAKKLTNARHVSFLREFNTYTGTYKNVPITVTSTGIGAPSAAIAMEEMFSCKMELAVRMGTVMGLSDDMLGKIFIPTACVRREKTSESYVSREYPAVCDFELLKVLSDSAKSIGRDVVTGINCTLDGFYSQMKESPLSEKMGFEHKKLFDELRRYSVKGIDMESSVFMVLGSLMGIKTCVITMTTVLENLKKALKGEERTRAEEDLCLAALEGIYSYHTRF